MSDRPDLDLVWFRPDGAQTNPAQWRTHPEAQKDALNTLIFDRESRDYVGWAGVVLINDRRVEDGWSEEEAVPTIIDGHGRSELALARDEEVPALVGHWTYAQERTILSTLDPLAMLAGTDTEKLGKLKDDLSLTEPLDNILGDLLASQGAFDMQPPTLEEIEEEYGEYTDEDNYPWLRVQVSPIAYARYMRLLDDDGFEDETALVEHMIWLAVGGREEE